MGRFLSAIAFRSVPNREDYIMCLRSTLKEKTLDGAKPSSVTRLHRLAAIPVALFIPSSAQGRARFITAWGKSGAQLGHSYVQNYAKPCH